MRGMPSGFGCISSTCSLQGKGAIVKTFPKIWSAHIFTYRQFVSEFLSMRAGPPPLATRSMGIGVYQHTFHLSNIASMNQYATLELIFLIDLRPELVSKILDQSYLRSFEMNRQQTYMGSNVGWMRCSLSLSPHAVQAHFNPFSLRRENFRPIIDVEDLSSHLLSYSFWSAFETWQLTSIRIYEKCDVNFFFIKFEKNHQSQSRSFHIGISNVNMILVGFGCQNTQLHASKWILIFFSKLLSQVQLGVIELTCVHNSLAWSVKR